MGKSLNSRPVGGNPRPGKSLISNTPVRSDTPRKTVAAPSSQYSQSASERPAVDLRDKVYKREEQLVGEEGIVRFVNMIGDMVSGFAILDNNVIKQNMELAAGNGMSIEDRTVQFEHAEYLISNFPYILMGIVLNENIKDAFIKALAVELSIDSQSPDVKAKTRAGMRDPKPSKSIGSIVIGITSFTKPIEDSFFDKMNATFELIAPYSDDFDETVKTMSMEDKLKLGMIFSNFMYLIRAFTHNDRFLGYIINVIEGVKTTLGLNT